MVKFFKSFFSTTAWAVWLVLLTTAGLMVLQMFTTVALPHLVAAYVLISVAGGYTGVDRLAQFVKSKELSFGSGDYGDVSKLRVMLFLLFLVFAEAIVLQVFYHVTGLAIEELLVAFGATSSAYVIGNKAVLAATFNKGQIDPTKVKLGNGDNVITTPTQEQPPVQQ